MQTKLFFIQCGFAIVTILSCRNSMVVSSCEDTTISISTASCDELDNWEAKADCYKQLVTNARQAEDWSAFVHAKVAFLELIDDYEDPKIAISFDSLIELAHQKLSPQSLVLAHALHRRGAIHYYRDEMGEAINKYKQALQIRLNNSCANPDHILRLYISIAQNYQRYNVQLDSSAFYLSKGITFLSDGKQITDIDDKAILFKEAGWVFDKLGETHKGLEYYETAKRISETEEGVWIRTQSRILWEYANVLIRAKKEKKAFHTNKQAENKLYENKEWGYWDSMVLADVYGGRAHLFSETSNFDSAKYYVNKRRLIYQNYGESIELAAGYNNLGNFSYQLGEYSEALDYLKVALSLNRKFQDYFQLAQTYDNIGDCYLKLNALEKAQANYDSSSYYFRYAPAIEQVNKIQNALYKRDLFEPTKSLARLQKRRTPTDYMGILSQYDSVDLVLRSLRQDLVLEPSKLIPLEEAKEVYEEAIEVCYQAYQKSGDKVFLEKAFGYFEKSKAAILLESMQRSNLAKSMIEPSYIEREKTLFKKRSDLETTLYTNKLDPKESAALNQLLAQNNNAITQLKNEIKTRFPKYTATLNQHQQVDLNQVKSKLESGQLIIEYFIGEHGLYIFLIEKNRLQLIKSDIDKAGLVDMLRSCRENVINGFALGTNQKVRDSLDAIYCKNASSLHTILIPEQYFSETTQSLIIIPDDELAYFPLGALLTEKTDPKAGYSNYPYLIKDYPIYYNYSLQVWLETPSNHFADQPTMLLVAPVQNKPFAPFSFAPQLFLQPLNPESEINALKELFSVQALTKRNATKRDFQKAINNHAIIHFAGHGIAFDSLPYQSSLIFDVSSKENEKEALLPLTELYNYDLNTELLVMSACQTAFGKLAKGEGIISLNRAGVLAGAKSVISTSWVINQEKKATFFNSFYSNLLKGQSKDVALQNAQLSFIDSKEDQAHPYFWASIVGYGNMDLIFKNQTLTAR